MRRFIIWLKRILFRNKYKRNLINELKPGDLFWGYLYEFKGNKIPKGHNLRSFMFVKFEGDIIHNFNVMYVTLNYSYVVNNFIKKRINIPDIIIF